MGRTRAMVAVGAVVGAVLLAPACAAGDDEPVEDLPEKDSGAAGAPAVDAGAAGAESGPVKECRPADCPPLADIAPPCCKDDGECGFDGSQIGLGCVSLEDIFPDAGLNPGADAGHPVCETVDLGFLKLVGCCRSNGYCGLKVPILNTCVDPQALPGGIQLPDSGPPAQCGPVSTGGTGGTGGAGGASGGAGGADGG